MTQETSVDTYAAIRDSGLLNELCLQVVKFILDHQDEQGYGGLISQADASRALDLNPETCDAIRPRFVELLECGVIAESGKKVDPRTERKVLGYRLTGRTPTIAPRRKHRTYKALLAAALTHVPEALRIEIAEKLRVTSFESAAA